jgi:hypothetical protein
MVLIQVEHNNEADFITEDRADKNMPMLMSLKGGVFYAIYIIMAE